MKQQSSDLVINTHNFEGKKNEIKAFAQSMPQEIELSEFKTKGGLFNWGDHTVKGTEMNNFTAEIQKHLVESNDRDKKIVSQLNNVYETFEYLDKDYIQKILISIKAAEKANKTADNAIRALKLTTTKLSEFKSKVEAIEHLYDIDDLWNYCQKWQETISLLTNSIQNIKSFNNEHAHEIENIKNGLKSTEKQILGLLNNLNQHIEKLNAVIDFKNELEKSIHLNDIDEMYDSLENLNSSLISIKEEFDSIKSTILEQKSNIDNLLLFMDEISKFEHLKDIDDIWNKTQEQQLVLSETQSNVASNTENIAELKKRYGDAVELIQLNKKYIDELNKIEHLRDVDEIWKLSNSHTSQLSELEKKNDEINNIIQQNKETTDAAISDIIEKNDSFIYTLTKKIKYAYILAGSSLGIAIIELIMILLKVI